MTAITFERVIFFMLWHITTIVIALQSASLVSVQYFNILYIEQILANIRYTTENKVKAYTANWT